MYSGCAKPPYRDNGCLGQNIEPLEPNIVNFLTIFGYSKRPSCCTSTTYGMARRVQIEARTRKVKPRKAIAKTANSRARKPVSKMLGHLRIEGFRIKGGRGTHPSSISPTP